MADKVIYEALGKAIARQRKFRDMTQQNLADAIGVSRASIANIERGQQRVYFDQVMTMIASFGLDNFEALVGGTVPSPQTKQDQVTFSGDHLKRSQKREVKNLVDQIAGLG